MLIGVCKNDALLSGPQLAAIREAYTEVRGEAEAARQELQQLQDAHRALQEQTSTALQEVPRYTSHSMPLDPCFS